MVENAKPVKTYKAGVLSLSLWENEAEEGTFKSFTFNKSYKDKDDSWQQTQILKTTDLPKLKLLLEQAYKDIVMS